MVFLIIQASQTLRELLLSKCDLYSGFKKHSILIIGIVKSVLITIAIIMIFLISLICDNLKNKIILFYYFFSDFYKFLKYLLSNYIISIYIYYVFHLFCILNCYK